MSRDWSFFLKDITEYAGYVAEFTDGMSFDEFAADAKTQNAVLRCLEVIGEAVKKIPPEILAEYPDVPWRRIARFRDRLARAYFEIDLEIAWGAARERLPEMLMAIQAIDAGQAKRPTGENGS